MTNKKSLYYMYLKKIEDILVEMALHVYQHVENNLGPSPEVIKKISCLTQLSMKFFLFINVKMPTFMSRKNNMIGLSEPEKKAEFHDIFMLVRI